MRTLIKLLFILSISLGLSYGSDIVNKKVYNEKSKVYYKKYKKEWNTLPPENKNRILETIKASKSSNLGYTLAATKFLENRGSGAKAVNKNIHKTKSGYYITYDCGEYGINTMTYLKSINKATKNHNAHLQACKKLASDYKLNKKMAIDTYEYALSRYDGNIKRSWNYYNTGRDKIINDRIYEVKGFIMLLEEITS